MREYLFKGKRIDNGEWVIGSLIPCAITGKRYILPKGSDANESDKVGMEGYLRFVAIEVHPETICEYTGINDKNGVRIFENDIVKFTPLLSFGGAICAVVEYDAPRYHAVNGVNGYALGRDCEVVANIHDNSELLKGKING